MIHDSSVTVKNAILHNTVNSVVHFVYRLCFWKAHCKIWGRSMARCGAKIPQRRVGKGYLRFSRKHVWNFGFQWCKLSLDLEPFKRFKPLNIGKIVTVLRQIWSTGGTHYLHHAQVPEIRQLHTDKRSSRSKWNKTVLGKAHTSAMRHWNRHSVVTGEQQVHWLKCSSTVLWLVFQTPL